MAAKQKTSKKKTKASSMDVKPVEIPVQKEILEPIDTPKEECCEECGSIEEPCCVDCCSENASTEDPKADPEISVDKFGLLKFGVVLVFVVVVAYFTYQFLLASQQLTFNPGPEVDMETFKSIFNSATEVNIVMDVRNAGDRNSVEYTNILQCGVDFAQSSGFGGKDARYFSLEGGSCIASDGESHTEEYCLAQLETGVTIYVEKGDVTSYHSKGMVVGVNKDYVVGTCGIHRV